MKVHRFGVWASSFALVSLGLVGAGLGACSSSKTDAADSPSTDSTDDVGQAKDSGKASTKDASTTPKDSGSSDKAAACTDTFGSSLTKSFGRLDGTVAAVVPPAHPTCPLPNSDHLVLQVKMGGEVYRMVVNVRSDSPSVDGGTYDVFSDATQHALVGGDWSDGWHENASLDYAKDLGVHKSEFTAHDLESLTATLTDVISVGAKVSVYATSSGGSYAGSAHLVHRNGANHDGAIVTSAATGSPTFYLFAFDEQDF